MLSQEALVTGRVIAISNNLKNSQRQRCIGLRPALVSLHYPPQMSAFSSHIRRNAYCR